MFQAISQRFNNIRRAATAQLAVDEAKTHVDIATDGYPAHLYEAINNRGSVSFADPVKRKANLAAEGLKDIFFHVDDESKEVSVESANERLQDTDYYLPKFLDDTLEDLISNGKNAVIFNEDSDTLKTIAKLSRLDNQSYSNKAKLVIDKALEIQRKKDTQLTEAPTGESNVSLLLTGNDELQRFGSVISLLESSLDSSKFGVEVLNKTIPDEIKRLSASFKEPMRTVVADELKATVDKILKEPKAVLDDDETPLAVKSAILSFAQRAIEAAYPGNIEKDVFAQKVIALIGAEPGSATLRQAQNNLVDELLGDVSKLVDIDIALKKAETHLSNVTDSFTRGGQIRINGEYRRATETDLTRARKAVKDIKESQAEVLQNSLEGTTKLKKAFEKLRLNDSDDNGTYSEGLKELFWSRLLDTDAGIENGWLSKLISAEGIKDVANISYSELSTINPNDYKGVAKKLASLMKSMAAEAEVKIIDEKAYLDKLMQAQQSLDSRLADRVGINFNEAIYSPAQINAINTLAQNLDAKEGNIAAGKLVTLIKTLKPQSKLNELLTEINLNGLTDNEKSTVSDVRQLMALSHLDQAQILSKLTDEHREKLAGFIQRTEQEILSLKIDYIDMLHASMERARGKGIEASAHLTALGLSSQVKAGTSSKDLSGLSNELNHLESQISTTLGVISELERSGASKEEFNFLRDETLKSFQSRTQKLSAALIEQLEPSNEQLSTIETELEKEAQTYFLAIEDGEQSNIIVMLAELFQSLLDKIGILRKDS